MLLRSTNDGQQQQQQLNCQPCCCCQPHLLHGYCHWIAACCYCC
jgi:hypothetical protein